MLDLSYFQNRNSNVQGFFNGGTWQTWIKPRGAKLVNFLCQGSGAGGGGGYQAATGVIGGGSGGGSGATARITVDANLLPNILYILPGIGGAGGTGGSTPTAGTAGQNSFICLTPDTSSISNIILRSGTTPAVAGLPGSSTAGGVLVAGETIGTVTNNIFVTLGVPIFIAGVSSGAGGTGAASGFTPTTYVTIATGGGGTSTGGSMNTIGVFPAVAATPVNTNGVGNVILYKPTLMLLGGFGGGGGTNGGKGGNGAPGAGGGGGGAGTTTAGNGGKGGDGFVIVTTSL